MPAIRRNWRKIAVFTALLTLTGAYSYYYAREWLAKWAFAHQTEFGVEEVILIAIPQTDLSARNAFLTNQEEFLWQGEMVDVLHRENRSDTLFIYGFRDAAETVLNQEAAWLYPHTTQPYSLPDAGTKWGKWFSPFVLPDGASLVPMIEYCLPVAAYSFLYSPLHVERLFLEVASPPPDLLVVSA